MDDYNEVPVVISQKDLDYLSDMFCWNFNACKLINHFCFNVCDDDIKQLLKEAYNIHKEHANSILNILQ